MQPTIELAKSSNTLNKLTFVLLYATDFADRLEKEIIPALKAGFIVLSDRYIFTALARAGVRGVDRQWLRNLYGFAIAPHLVFYLKIDVKTLIRRVLQSRGMDYWESGMDLKLGDDIYDSFRAYQRALLREYASMADEFGFRVLDARRKVDVIQDELRRQIGAFLADAEMPAASRPRPCRRLHGIYPPETGVETAVAVLLCSTMPSVQTKTPPALTVTVQPKSTPTPRASGLDRRPVPELLLRRQARARGHLASASSATWSPRSSGRRAAARARSCAR